MEVRAKLFYKALGLYIMLRVCFPLSFILQRCYKSFTSTPLQKFITLLRFTNLVATLYKLNILYIGVIFYKSILGISNIYKKKFISI